MIQIKAVRNIPFKNYWIIFLVFVQPIVTPKEIQAQTFYFGLNTSIDYNSYGRITNIGPTDYKGKTNFSSGLVIQYNLNAKISLKTKVNYSSKNFQEVTDLNYFVPLDPNDPLINGGSEVKVDHINRYIDVPIEINYKLNKNKAFDVVSIVGFVNSFQFDSDHRTNSKLLEVRENRYNTYLFSVKTGMGFLYKLNRFGIYMEPQIRFYMNSVHTDVPSKNPIHLGFEFSILKI
jgi:hypothetical protein